MHGAQGWIQNSHKLGGFRTTPTFIIFHCLSKKGSFEPKQPITWHWGTSSLLLLSLLALLFQTNTYQGLVVTDGEQSYTIFTYNCQLMGWSGHAGIGINAKGIFHRNHNFSTSEDAKEVACLNFPESNWSNVMYQLRMFNSVNRITNGHMYSVATPLYSGWPHPCVQGGHTPVYPVPVIA